MTLLIASYSGYYRMPLTRAEVPWSNRLRAVPPAFGYNEATHKFNLPPAHGSARKSYLYASRLRLRDRRERRSGFRSS